MKRLILWLLAAAMLLLPVSAAEPEPGPTEIHTVEELLAISQFPSGIYSLMADLDMTGIAWKSPDFSGIFYGNGHSILNLTLTEPCDIRYDSYDGNAKAYETAYYGFFGALRQGSVSDLNLVNVRALVESDEPCFVAGIAGYLEQGSIENCRISGTLELRAHDRIFGVGGIVGYGVGSVRNCQADVTLICVDTDDATKDEQFLGGVFATGFVDTLACTVLLDAYISEHGYVHSGGITGMYYQGPYGTAPTGVIKDNRVEGKITFFENNPDRRAYCAPFIGESLNYYGYYEGGNTQQFLRDEVRDYSKELRPDMCETPTYTQTVTPAGCDSFGFTTFVCDTCGYGYTDHYTLPAHTLTAWTLVQPATEETEGLEEAGCDLCGMTFTRVLEKLPPQPTETETPATQPIPETENPPTEFAVQDPEDSKLWLLLLPGIAAALIAGIPMLKRKKK